MLIRLFTIVLVWIVVLAQVSQRAMAGDTGGIKGKAMSSTSASANSSGGVKSRNFVTKGNPTNQGRGSKQ